RHLVTFSNNIPDDFATRVASLGGSVRYQHAAAGLAIVQGLSDAAASALAASNGVAAVEADVMLSANEGTQSRTLAAPDAPPRRSRARTIPRAPSSSGWGGSGT